MNSVNSINGINTIKKNAKKHKSHKALKLRFLCWRNFSTSHRPKIHKQRTLLTFYPFKKQTLLKKVFGIESTCGYCE